MNIEEIEDDLLRSSSAKLNAGKVEGARAELLAYLDRTERRPARLLANLLFTFIGRKDERAGKYCDAAIAILDTDRLALHTVALPVNLSRVLNDNGRHADAVAVCQKAIKHGYFSADCWLNMTFAAIQSRDPKLLKASVARLDKIIDTKPKNIASKLGTVVPVFDNAATIHLLLGDKKMALRYVALCKEYEYEAFAKMPQDPGYASLKGDPAFKKLFHTS